MSVAGLKKQFHKATQVRRGAGAPRGGPGRSRKGRARRWQSPGSGSGDPGPPAAPRSARSARPARRGISGLGTVPGLPTPSSARAAGCGLQWVPRAPPPQRPGRALQGGDPRCTPGAQVSLGWRLCKVAYFPGDLAVSVHPPARELLARPAPAPGQLRGCPRCVPAVVSESLLPRPRRLRSARMGLLLHGSGIKFSLGNLVVKLLGSQGLTRSQPVFKHFPRVLQP